MLSNAALAQLPGIKALNNFRSQKGIFVLRIPEVAVRYLHTD